MEVVTLWVPAYWIAGVIKCVTALASVPTAVLVARIFPQALTFVSAEQLRAANQELECSLRPYVKAKVRTGTWSNTLKT